MSPQRAPRAGADRLVVDHHRPYRETTTAIAAARDAGIARVEMEAAALYAYATTRQRSVVCLAHITNTMATGGDDFEKGVANGAHDALAVAAAVATALR